MPGRQWVPEEEWIPGHDDDLHEWRKDMAAADRAPAAQPDDVLDLWSPDQGAPHGGARPDDVQDVVPDDGPEL